MRLTIDTEKDTKEDLRKAIRFLQLMVNDREYRNPTERRQIEEVKSEAANMAAFFNSVEPPADPSPAPKNDFKLDFF